MDTALGLDFRAHEFASCSMTHMMFGQGAPTLAIRPRFVPQAFPESVFEQQAHFSLTAAVYLTKDLTSYEKVELPWKLYEVGQPRWFDDTTIFLPAYDRATDTFNLYESKDQFRTWAKKAVLWDDRGNRARAPSLQRQPIYSQDLGFDVSDVAGPPFYYNPKKYNSYLEQLGIKYPNLPAQ